MHSHSPSPPLKKIGPYHGGLVLLVVALYSPPVICNKLQAAAVVGLKIARSAGKSLDYIARARGICLRIIVEIWKQTQIIAPEHKVAAPPQFSPGSLCTACWEPNLSIGMYSRIKNHPHSASWSIKRALPCLIYRLCAHMHIQTTHIHYI